MTIIEEKYKDFSADVHAGHIIYLSKKINHFGEYRTMLQEAIKHSDYETIAFMTARQIAMENPSSKPSENEYIYFNIPGRDEITKYANMYKNGEPIDVRICQAEETYNPDMGNKGEIIPVATINFGYIFG